MLRADRLAALRKSKGLLQKDVAKAFGLERTSYGKYESSGIQPPTDMVVKLADYFGVSTDYLLGKSDIPNLPEQMLSNTSKQDTTLLTTEEFLAQRGITGDDRIAMIEGILSLMEKAESDSEAGDGFIEKRLVSEVSSLKRK